MEKIKFYEVFSLKNIVFFILKTIVLFVILYFTVTTAAVLLFLLPVTAILYIALFLGLTYFIANIPKKESDKEKNFFMRHILKPLLLLIGTGLIFLAIVLTNMIRDKIEIYQMRAFIDKADEIIEYNTSTFYMDGLIGTDYQHDLILIDFDTMTIGFLYRPYVMDRLEKIPLTQNSSLDMENIQCQYELDSPGVRFTAYYPNESSKHRTTAIELEMADGTFYSAKNLTDDSGHVLFLNLG